MKGTHQQLEITFGCMRLMHDVSPQYAGVNDSTLRDQSRPRETEKVVIMWRSKQ